MTGLHEEERPAALYQLPAQTYAQGRAGYSPQLIDYVLRQNGLDRESLKARGKTPEDITIADIGSGTGLLSIPLARMGYRVVCVDPSPTMNAALAEELKKEKETVRKHIVIQPGEAHATGLAEHSVDLLVVGTAAHWFAVSDHAHEVAGHWKAILKTSAKDGKAGQAAIFYAVPSLEDPVVQEVHQALTEGPLKDTHLAAAYRDPPFYYFSDWSTISRYPCAMLDEKDNKGGLNFAMEDTVEDRAGGAHPIDKVLDYFNSTSLGLTLKAHPEEGEALAKYVKSRTSAREGDPLHWACRVYLGEPRERALNTAEQFPPSRAAITELGRGKGLYTGLNQ